MIAATVSGVGVRGEPVLVEQPGHFSPPCQPAVYWPQLVVSSNGSARYVADSTLIVSTCQETGLKLGRLFHRGQRQQLHQMILDNITGFTDAVVGTGSVTKSDVFGHGDLHMCVPDRIPQLIGESKRRDVLHCLFAQVVVDTKIASSGKTALSDLFRSRELSRLWSNGVSVTTRLQLSVCGRANSDLCSC